MEEKEGVNPAGMVSAARRVLVVDDSVLVRQGLRSILESSSELSVIGEAENGREWHRGCLHGLPHQT
jgi:DNA-binding NarL/FixJ family response regulator